MNAGLARHFLYDPLFDEDVLNIDDTLPGATKLETTDQRLS